MTDRPNVRIGRVRAFLVAVAGQAFGLAWIGALVVFGWAAGLVVRQNSATTPSIGGFVPSPQAGRRDALHVPRIALARSSGHPRRRSAV